MEPFWICFDLNKEEFSFPFHSFLIPEIRLVVLSILILFFFFVYLFIHGLVIG